MYHNLIVDPRIRAKPADLFEAPHVVLVQEFDNDAVKKFREDMQKAHSTGQPIIPIVIDSYGGYVHGCLDMISQIQSASLPVHTIVAGKAMSAGAMLFSMGDQRWLSKNADLMFHDVSSWHGGKLPELKVSLEHTKQLSKKLFGLVETHCGLGLGYFEERLHTKGGVDWYMLPREAKQLNICTKIGMPSLTTEVTVKYKFG